MSSVDVIVPCYNYARFLRYCVDTILAQRDVSVRVLIIDDKSTDDTPAVGARLAEQDARVTFRRHEVNQGLIGTANEGLMGWASADYTLLLSADDALTPGALARAASVLDAHPELGMVYGKAIIIRDDFMPEGLTDPGPATHQILSGRTFLQRCCEHGNPVPSPAAIVRTSVQHRLGGYSPKMRHTSDMEMWMRIATQYPIGVIREAQACYRRHDSNMTWQYLEKMLSDSRERLRTCEHVYQERNGADIPGFSLWLGKMKESFGLNAYWLAGQAFEAGDMAAFETCLAFAMQCHPLPWYSAPRLRLRAKTLLGPALIGKLRKMRSGGGRFQDEDWATSEDFGWWPEPDDLLAQKSPASVPG